MNQEEKAITPPVRRVTTKPSIAEIAQIAPGTYVEWNNDDGRVQNCVNADSIDDIHIFFTCPFCYTQYNSDGRPRSKAKRVVHQHGSGGYRYFRDNEHRVAHCSNAHAENGFLIYITPSTIGAHPRRENE